MGAKIAVTIGIVSRGNEPFLGECLRAVASQNLDGLEVIVADISDEGGRQELFTNWLGKRQKCLYRHLPRCAAGAAKNYLLETAAGEYIAFLGEDICYLPGGLEKLYAQAKESGADMVIGRAAGGSFGGKEYPAAWTVDNVLKLGRERIPQRNSASARCCCAKVGRGISCSARRICGRADCASARARFRLFPSCSVRLCAEKPPSARNPSCIRRMSSV